MSTHYTVRGATTAAGVYCGFSLVHFAVSPGITNWHVGAALSFRLSTHYTLRGGHSGLGVDCGEFFVGATTAASYTSLRACAAISLEYTLCCSRWCF